MTGSLHADFNRLHKKIAHLGSERILGAIFVEAVRRVSDLNTRITQSLIQHTTTFKSGVMVRERDHSLVCLKRFVMAARGRVGSAALTHDDQELVYDLTTKAESLAQELRALETDDRFIVKYPEGYLPRLSDMSQADVAETQEPRPSVAA